MAVGKNKGLSKGGKKGGKKKVIDPFSRKDWYDVKAPNMFHVRQIGKTLVNRTQGQRIASDYLKWRVFEVSVSDLQKDNDADRSFRKFGLIAEDVQHRNVLCNFHERGCRVSQGYVGLFICYESHPSRTSFRFILRSVLGFVLSIHRPTWTSRSYVFR